MSISINGKMSSHSVPPGFSVIEIDGQVIEQGGQILLLRDEDQQQFWMSLGDAATANCDGEWSMPDGGTQEEPLDEDARKRKEWTAEETRHFIYILIEHKASLRDSKTKKKAVFEDIAKAVAAQSDGKYRPTPLQCENRYKSLLKKYKEINDHNNTSGNDRKDWEFLELMTEFCGERPNVTPVSSCSSFDITHSEGKRRDEKLRRKLSDKLNRSNESNVDRAIVKERPKKKTKVRSELLQFMETMEKSAEERESTRLRVSQEQHNDFTKLMERFITAVTDTKTTKGQEKI